MKMFEEKTRREFEFNKTRFRRFYSTKIAYKFYHRISLCWNIQWMRISLEAILKIARYFIWYFEVHWGAQAVATSWEKKTDHSHHSAHGQISVKISSFFEYRFWNCWNFYIFGFQQRNFPKTIILLSPYYNTSW